MQLSSGILFLLLPYAAISISVAPKTDFGEASPGINPEIVKTIIEKNLEPTISPGVVKAVLEVSVGGVAPKTKPESKTDEKDKKKKKNQVLICTLEGDCTLHQILVEGDTKDDEKKLKPIVVTDFNVDPSKEKHDGGGDKKEGKDVPDVPVFVGHKGAVKDDGFSYYAGGHDQQTDRIPVYYGMKLSPAFHQTYPPPGSIIYEDGNHYPPISGSYPYEHGVSYLYSNEEDEYPIGYPSYPPQSHSHHGNSFSGHPGARTPTPYGKYFPTNKQSYQGVITPLHRRSGGGGGWSSTPGVYWPPHKSNEVPHHDGSGWVGSTMPGWVTPTNPGSNRPGVYMPPEKPHGDCPPPGIVYVHDKIDFDNVPLNGGGHNPSDPSNPGKEEVTVDGKLGEPLDNEES